MNCEYQIGALRRVAETKLPTKWGEFRAVGFSQERCNGGRRFDTALALIIGDVTAGAPLLRIHSQCLTGDTLGSLRCDCGQQLELAMDSICREGRGILIYEYQEGRGIGLSAKLQAYRLQDEGLDTVEANHALGYHTDYRDFELPPAILHDLGIFRVRLLSNNPEKARRLTEAGIDVVDVLSCEIPPNQYSATYLRAKKEKMGHHLSLNDKVPCGGENSALVGKQFRAAPRAPVAELSPAGIHCAINELRAGRMIVVVDDADRENEGDLVIAAEMVSPQAINFMATHAKGLICLAMDGERLDDLDLSPMAPESTALGGTGFTVSIDAKLPTVTTGISAHDRATTIRAAIDPTYGPEDFARPGHVFPLRSRADGVLERRGHTEAAVDLARLAGLKPSGVICEILNQDGTMARLPDLVRFCALHSLKLVTIADLVKYRTRDFSGKVTIPPPFAAANGRGSPSAVCRLS